MALTTDGKSKSPNGSLKPPKGINGIGGVNGLVVPARRTRVRKRRSFFAWSFGIIARLFTWYSIFSVVFRCPPTLEACTDETPKICRPYFEVKAAVLPRILPYYDAYAAPYVDFSRPYYDAIDRIVIVPAYTYAVKYGGPKLIQAQTMGRAKWEKNVQPQLGKYQDLARAQYERTVAPHVERVLTAVSPYYDIARTNALQGYHEFILPTYLVIQPYASQGYDAAYTFTVNTAIPSAIRAWHKTYVFLDSTVWPHVRDVYVMKVEPQLLRIGERLGRYKERKIKSLTEDAYSLTPKSAFSKPTASVSSPTNVDAESTANPRSSSENVDHPEDYKPAAEIDIEQTARSLTSEEAREQAAKTVTEDLELWEGKFTKAAEDGAAEIEERIDEISDRMVQRHAYGMGKSLVKQLDDTASIELENLRKSIISILETRGDRTEKIDEALTAVVRNAGLKIRDRAQDIRTWRQAYDQETEIAVTKAAEEHYSILQQTRDLALQKIGMKWAWMDGVTYKDWQKYHQLRDRFNEWTEDFKRLITTHPGLEAARAAGASIEEEGMGIAQAAAQELGRLKQVATWKSIAGDSSDDFDSEKAELAAIAVARKMSHGVEDATSVGNNPTKDTESDTEWAASEPNNDPLSSPPPGSAEPAETVKISLSRYSSEEPGTSILPPTEGLEGEPNDAADDAITEIPDGSIIPGEETVSTTVRSALFGAAAQSVPSRQPILDEDIVLPATDISASITSAAQSAYTTAIAGAADHYSRAMSVVSAQIQEGRKPIHEEMLSSVSSAYLGAVAAANSRLSSAMEAAAELMSETLIGGGVPPTSTIPPVDCESQYTAVSSLVSELLVGKEAHVSESVYSRLAEAYPTAALPASSLISAAYPTASSARETVSDKAQEGTRRVVDEL
ncbi:hypothetical protein GGS23DRAFT_604922 [Durotheca rogersii]|uniref:uncharacterized protein n=1 Tax=Durotheca rogersii TaxID=419775 RepID=UPI00221E7519|nr:uncharacterized protein GGS23DRAFT_604922 [Durotheca rogersii]KAI5863309.1 hypothetical protein GGS23DRAFT_604922 [Durotheca rogersii]